MKYKILLSLTLSTISFFPLCATTTMIDSTELSNSTPNLSKSLSTSGILTAKKIDEMVDISLRTSSESLAKSHTDQTKINIVDERKIDSSKSEDMTNILLQSPSIHSSTTAVDQKADEVIDTVKDQLENFNVSGLSLENEALTFIMNVIQAEISGNSAKIGSIFLETFEKIVDNIKQDAMSILLNGYNEHHLSLSDFQNIKITSLNDAVLKFNLVFAQGPNIYEIPEQIHCITFNTLKIDLEEVPAVTKSIFKRLFPCFTGSKTS